jgi:hypothetical protein
MAKIDVFLRDHHERKMEQFNEAMTMFRDAALLNRIHADEIITALNANLLCEKGNRAAKYLRRVMGLAIDIIQTEDAIEASKQEQS